MTSIRRLQSRRAMQEELRIFNGFSRVLRDAINTAEASVRPSIILNTLLRGVPERAIIEAINKRSPKP